MTEGESLSFDRAADHYDATRSLTPEVADATTNALDRELSAIGAKRILEIGIGTGRIARPLAERGHRITGIDISTKMMGHLIAQLTAKHVAPDLLIADATEMPFRDDAFDATVISHVLHLIPAWKRAVAELKRVIRPDGIVLNTSEEYSSPGDWDAASKQWEKAFAARNFRRRQRASPEDMLAEAQSHGAKCEVFNAAEWDETTTPQQELDWARTRLHSWSWDVPDDILDASIPEVEAWAAEHYGSLEAKLHRPVAQIVQVWRFP